MSAKSIEWRPGPTVCRCCLTEGCYKDISTEYFWMGKREVYGEMLLDTFNVTIAYSQSGGPNSNSRLICEPCISRLRDANDFRRQVLECEKTFMQHLDPGSSSVADLEVPVENLEESVKLEQIKLEKRLSDDEFDERDYDDDDDDDDDMDDEPLTKLASKIPKKEVVDLMDLLDNTKAAEKRKSSTKVKAAPSKKSKIVKKEPVKASASKVAPKPEKKKKGASDKEIETEPSATVMWKRIRRVNGVGRNAAIIINNSNAVVFRFQRGKFMCAYCPAIFANVGGLRIHSQAHENDELFEKSCVKSPYPHRIDITNLTCTLCGQATLKFDDLKEHLSEKHSKNIDPEFSDGVIPFILTNKEYKCVHCGLLCESFMMISVHMNEHYRHYICSICGKSFSNRPKFKGHLRIHECGEFDCPKCDSVFLTRAAKNSHMSTTHGRKDRHKCPICDERFGSHHARLRHLDRAHGQKVDYKCNECPAVFGSASLRYSHVRRVHLNKKSKKNKKK